MNKHFIVLFILVILSCGCYATEIQDISVLEKEILGIEYKDKPVSERLNQIETKVFGNYKTGNTSERIKKVSEATGISLLPKPTNEQKNIAAADMEPEDSNVTYPVIDMMEEKLFKKNNQGENVYKRIERLEKEIYGKISEGDLSTRTDKLKASILTVNPEKITYNEDYQPNNYPKYQDDILYPSRPLLTKKKSYTGGAAPLNESYYNSYDNSATDFEFALTAAENLILGKNNKTDSHHERLNKLEKKIFKKTYSDDNISRLDRIVSAAHAQKTGKVFNENKWNRYITTGLQIGTIVLMILAMIL